MVAGSPSHPTAAPPTVSTKEQIVRFLQATGRATVGELASHCDVSDAAMRQHLDQLEADGLVGRATTDNTTDGNSSSSRGRPPTYWILNATSSDRRHAIFPDTFPDRHAELSGEILESLAGALGESAVVEVLEHRARHQIDDYRITIASALASQKSGHPNDLAAVVTALARIRDAEGYRAEAVDHGDGTISLVEHHCAIGAAARTCGELCESETKVFGKVLDRALGTRVAIRRVEHLMSDGNCCRYEIRPR